MLTHLSLRYINLINYGSDWAEGKGESIFSFKKDLNVFKRIRVFYQISFQILNLARGHTTNVTPVDSMELANKSNWFWEAWPHFGQSISMALIWSLEPGIIYT